MTYNPTPSPSPWSRGGESCAQTNNEMEWLRIILWWESSVISHRFLCAKNNGQFVSLVPYVALITQHFSWNTRIIFTPLTILNAKNSLFSDFLPTFALSNLKGVSGGAPMTLFKSLKAWLKMIMSFCFYLLLLTCVGASKTLVPNLLARCPKATLSISSVS